MQRCPWAGPCRSMRPLPWISQTCTGTGSSSPTGDRVSRGPSPLCPGSPRDRAACVTSRGRNSGLPQTNRGLRHGAQASPPFLLPGERVCEADLGVYLGMALGHVGDFILGLFSFTPTNFPGPPSREAGGPPSSWGCRSPWEQGALGGEGRPVTQKPPLRGAPLRAHICRAHVKLGHPRAQRRLWRGNQGPSPGLPPTVCVTIGE